MNPSAASARLLRAAIGRSGPTTPDAGDSGAWIQLAITERVVPLLSLVIRSDAPPWSTDALDELHAQHLAVASTAVGIERGLLTVIEALDAAGIGSAVLKGVATAHLDHPDPSWRQFGDADLLVAPADLERTCAVLAESGWHQAYALPRFHRPFTHAVTLESSTPPQLDVHQRLARRALGLLVPTEDLLAARVPYQIADRTLFALCDTDRLIHACLHLVSSRGEYRRLSSVADVLLLSYLNEHQAAAVVARADNWRVRSIVGAAVIDAWREAQLPVPDGWRRALAAPGTGRRTMVDRVYLGRSRRPVVEEMVFLATLPSIRDRARYLWGHVAVGDDYRRARRWSNPADRLRYAWSRTRHR